MLYHWMFSDFFSFDTCVPYFMTYNKKGGAEVNRRVHNIKALFTLRVCELIKKFLDIFCGRYSEMRHVNDADRICRILVLQNAKHESGTGWKWRAVSCAVTGTILSVSLGFTECVDTTH